MIRVEDLVYRFEERTVLNGISLTIGEAEIFSIMGTSGCGKTTFLKCLAGLLRPTSGSVFLDDLDLVPLPEKDLNQVRRDIGMVFQYAALFDSMTIAENVAFPLHRFTDYNEAEIAERVRELLSQVGLHQVEDMYPEELSGGMRKRVGLARAMAGTPRIILYDEPSSGLDPINAANIDRLILRTRDQFGVTSVIASHHIQNVFSISDRVTMFYQGQLLALGTPAELQETQNAVVRQFITGGAEGPLEGMMA